MVPRPSGSPCFVLPMLASLLFKPSEPPPTWEAVSASPCAFFSPARSSPPPDTQMITSLPSFRCLLQLSEDFSVRCYRGPHPNCSLSVGPALYFLSVTINYRLCLFPPTGTIGVLRRGALFPVRYPRPKTVHCRHSENRY